MCTSSAEPRSTARYLPLGDAAITVEFGAEINPELHHEVRAFVAALDRDPLPGVRDIVPAYASVTVQFDPLHPEAAEMDQRLREVEARSRSLELPPGRLHLVPVHYGGGDGPDLEDVARLHGLNEERFIGLHSNAEYAVYCVGFSPGFVYLGGLPEQLHTPRLDSPRKLVPAGSVGIGGQQTGVYPSATPGGWRLIGRTNFTFFDLTANPPCPIRLGDRIRFEPVDDLPPGHPTQMTLPEQHERDPILQILKPGLFTTIQDLGRWGYQASGVSVGGAMDPLALRVANGLVGNEPNAACLEMTLLGPSLRVSQPCTVALAGADTTVRLNARKAPNGVPLDLKPGDELEVGRAVRGARSYLAVAGGIDVPVALGSRSTYTRAGFGGLEGRTLRSGDTLAVGRAKSVTPLVGVGHVPLPASDDVTIRVVLGSEDGHFSPETINRFLNQPFQISSEADRMGYRLGGEPLTHLGGGEVVSDGVVLGSIQVPPNGMPIVMLADRASIGGYPKIATVITADVRLIAQCRPGTQLRFQATTPEKGRQALRDLEQAAFAANLTDERLPIHDVRSLLTSMRAKGLDTVTIESNDGRIHLHRGAADPHTIA